MGQMTGRRPPPLGDPAPTDASTVLSLTNVKDFGVA